MSDQSIVEVTQADRDDAGELYRRYLGEGSAVEAAILDGEYDHDERVQILARHRIAEREACAMVAEAYAEGCAMARGNAGAMNDRHAVWQAEAERLASLCIAAAIRARS